MLDFLKPQNDWQFVIDNTSSLSFTEILDRAKTISIPKELIRSDYVALLCRNNKYFIEHLIAIWLEGLIPVPLNYQLKEKQIKEMLESIDCNLALVDTEFKKEFNSICNSVLSFDELETKNSTQEIKRNETALVLFTSGSTSFPKAVSLSHNNFESHFSSANFEFLFSQADNWLTSLPFYHIGGFAIIMRALFSKAKLSLIDNFKIDAIIDSLIKYNPSHISIVPTQLFYLVKNNIQPNTNHKIMFLGGGPCDEKLLKSALQLGWNIVKVYGSTETCSMVSSVNLRTFPNKLNSSGRMFSGNRIKIISSTGKILDQSESGEIVISSSAIAKGYLNSDNSAFGMNQYSTKDLGFIDEDGFLYIEMRREDLIVTGGENVNPAEIEMIVKKNLKYVDDCKVFGINDLKWGQRICAAVKSTDKDLDETQIREQLKALLPSFKIPKSIKILKEFPTNDMGKLNVNELKNLFM